MIIKKCKSLKSKLLIEILFNLGIRRQKKGLYMLYIINRYNLSKIIICVAKKKIKDSVKRNIIKRRIKTAYKIYFNNINLLQLNLIIIFFWKKKKIPSLGRIKILMKKILHII